MTDEAKPKKPRNKRPLGAGEAFDRIAELRDSRQARLDELLDEFAKGELEKEAAFVALVPTEQRARLDKMMRADERTKADEIPAALREPAPPRRPGERLEVDRATRAGS